jgi:hypothetical protein
VCAVPFVLVSGAYEAGHIARVLGIADVLHKPFDADRFLRIVGLHCHRAP